MYSKMKEGLPTKQKQEAQLLEIIKYDKGIDAYLDEKEKNNIIDTILDKGYYSIFYKMYKEAQLLNTISMYIVMILLLLLLVGLIFDIPSIEKFIERFISIIILIGTTSMLGIMVFSVFRYGSYEDLRYAVLDFEFRGEIFNSWRKQLCETFFGKNEIKDADLSKTPEDSILKLLSLEEKKIISYKSIVNFRNTSPSNLFELSQVNILYTQTNNKNLYLKSTIAKIKFHHPRYLFNPPIHIRTRGNILDEALISGFSDNSDLENIQFEKNFLTNCEDQIFLRQILNPKILDDFVSFGKEKHLCRDFIFENDSILISLSDQQLSNELTPGFGFIKRLVKHFIQIKGLARFYNMSSLKYFNI